MHLTFLGPLGLLVAVSGLGVTIAARGRDRAARERLPLGVALCASVIAILSLTTGSAPGSNKLQLVPVVYGLRSLVDGHSPVNAIGNLVLFAPFGASLCLLGLRRGPTVLIGLAFSTAIEITQLFIPGRTTSVNDVLLNTVSTLLGFLLVARWATAPPASPAG